MDPLEARLRAALVHTSAELPRPVTPLELPLGLDRLVMPRLLRGLKPASVLVPVMRRSAGLSVLLTRRSEDMPSHKGQISFPGGRRQPDDASAAAAALREAEEEVGIPRDAVEVIGYLDDYPTVTRYLVTPVVGVVEGLDTFKPCQREVAEIFEVPLARLLNHRNFEKGWLTTRGVKVPFFEIHHGRHRIWGATAGMLWNMARKFEGHDAQAPA